MQIYTAMGYAQIAFFVVAPIVGAVVIATRTRGNARTLGVIGCLVLAVSSLVTPLVYSLMATVAVRGTRSYPMLYRFADLALGLISLVGLGLIIAAIRAGRRPAFESR